MRRVMASSSAEKKFIPPIVCIPLVELKINQPFSFTVASDALRRPAVRSAFVLLKSTCGRRAFILSHWPDDFQCCAGSVARPFSQHGNLHMTHKDTSSPAINMFSALEA